RTQVGGSQSAGDAPRFCKRSGTLNPMNAPSENPLASGEAMKALAERLERCPQIAKLTDEVHSEAWTIAHSLSDLADSSEAFRNLTNYSPAERLSSRISRPRRSSSSLMVSGGSSRITLS